MTRRLSSAAVVAGAVGMVMVVAALSIWWRFEQEIDLARARSTQGSTLIATRSGPIEVQQAACQAVTMGSTAGHGAAAALWHTIT